MNSVDKYLNAQTKAATLLAMRSAKKEVLLVVEGDSDIDMFASVLGISRSNILSCNGKEVLMLVYDMGTQKGIDPGTVFIRDRDHDGVTHDVRNGVLLLVTDRYDIEMDLLETRLFKRIISEFFARELTQEEVEEAFVRIAKAAANIGVLRLYAREAKIPLDLDDIRYARFLNFSNLDIDSDKMVVYLFAKSQVPLADKSETVAFIARTLKKRPYSSVCCGKEFLDLSQIALSRFYRVCTVGESSVATLGRMLRISATLDDLKAMSMYSLFVQHVRGCGFSWTGVAL